MAGGLLCVGGRRAGLPGRHDRSGWRDGAALREPALDLGCLTPHPDVFGCLPAALQLRRLSVAAAARANLTLHSSLDGGRRWRSVLTLQPGVRPTGQRCAHGAVPMVLCPWLRCAHGCAVLMAALCCA